MPVFRALGLVCLGLHFADGAFAVSQSGVCAFETPAAHPRRPLIAYWTDNIKCFPAFAFGLLLFNFARLSALGSVPWLNWAAKSVFAVYVIHQVPAFQQFEWQVIFRAQTISRLPPWQCALSIVGVSLAVFVAASLIDALRLRFIAPLLERVVTRLTRRFGG